MAYVCMTVLGQIVLERVLVSKCVVRCSLFLVFRFPLVRELMVHYQFLSPRSPLNSRSPETLRLVYRYLADGVEWGRQLRDFVGGYHF